MKVLKFSTTAYEEEDFFIMTDLSEEQIIEVIKPIVQNERDGFSDYDNDTLIDALKKRYHGRTIKLYQDFDTIKI